MQTPARATHPPQMDTRLRTKIPAGKRAYALEMEAVLPLREGDEVDLFLTGSGPEAGYFLQGARVLDARAPHSPILALDPAEIRWVETAKTQGKLRVAVRSALEEPSRKRGQFPVPSRVSRRPSAIAVWEDG